MRTRLPRMTPTRLFWLLMAVSALLFVLPQRVTDGLRSVSQLLVPGQYVLFSSTARLGDTLHDVAEPPVPRDEHRRVQAENEALTGHLLALENEVGRLRRENARLARLRDGDGLESFRLIEARIVAEDVAAYRDRLIIDQGERKDVRPTDWVATRRFLDVGDTADARPGHAVLAGEHLAGEYLIGRIERVRPYVSRVRLFSDPAAGQPPVRVRTGRRESAAIVFSTNADGEQVDFLLIGAGRDEMRVTQVDRSLWDDGRIRPGDLVFTSPGASGLPRSMIIGTVTDMVRDRGENELLCELVVTWPFEWTNIRAVYVIAPPDGA